MRKGWLISLLLALVAALPAAGADGLFSSGRAWRGIELDYGLEWGYSAAVLERYHFNYLTSSGARIDSRDMQTTFKSNGHLYGYLGARYGRRFSTDILTGWAGVFEGRQVMPLTLRTSCFFSGWDSESWKVFLEGGWCLCRSYAGKPVTIAKAGFGRRTMLDRRFALDLALSVQGVSDHPLDVYDKSNDNVVPDARLRRSDCSYLSVNFTLALCF